MHYSSCPQPLMQLGGDKCETTQTPAQAQTTLDRLHGWRRRFMSYTSLFGLMLDGMHPQRQLCTSSSANGDDENFSCLYIPACQLLCIITHTNDKSDCCIAHCYKVQRHLLDVLFHTSPSSYPSLHSIADLETSTLQGSSAHALLPIPFQ